MSSQSSAKQLPPDQAREKVVRLLFVVRSAKGLKTPIQFLKRRGWQIAVVESIREAVPKILEGKPTAILLSWNMRGTNVIEAYRLITNKFQSLCILFAEDSSPKTELALMSAGVQHIMLPPNSGPRMFTRIQTILRATDKRDGLQDSDLDSNDSTRTTHSMPKDAHSITPDRIPEEGSWIKINEQSIENGVYGTYKFKPSKSDGAENSATYYFQGESPPEFSITEKKWSAKNSPGGLFFQERLKSKMMQATQGEPGSMQYNYSSNEGTVSHEEKNNMVIVKSTRPEKKKSRQSESDPKDEETDLFSDEALAAKDEESSDEVGSADETRSDKGSGQGRRRKKKGYSNYEGTEFKNPEIKPSEKSAPEVEFTENDDGDWNELSLDVDHTEDQESGETFFSDAEDELGNVRTENSKKTKSGEVKSKIEDTDSNILGEPKRKPQTILEKSIFEAVEETSQKFIAKGRLQKILHPTFYNVAIINTPRFNGYLVSPSRGKDSAAKEGQIFKEVWSRIHNKMLAAGETMDDMDSPLFFKLDTLEYFKWIDEKCEFYALGNYKEDQVSFAFYSCKTNLAVEKTAGEMISFPLIELNPEVELTFNVYLHMKKNDRYLLYFKPGFKMSPDKIQKLKEFGHLQIFVKKSQEKELLAYIAACEIHKSVFRKDQA